MQEPVAAAPGEETGKLGRVRFTLTSEERLWQICRLTAQTVLNAAIWPADKNGMVRQFAFHAAASRSPQAERRLRGRLRQQGVVSNVGPVMDISAGGIRVLSTKHLQDMISLQIVSQTGSVHVPSRVVWCTKAGFRRYFAGLKFETTDEATLRAIARIAAAHRVQVAI